MSHAPESKRLDLDDPRLSAYALGEMEGSEREAFESLLENDADARAEVEAIRGLGTDLEQAFAAEAPLALRPEQKAQIQAASRAPQQSSSIFHRVVGWSAAAAVLAGVVTLANVEPEVVEQARAKSELTASTSAATAELSAIPSDTRTGEAWTRVQVPERYVRRKSVEVERVLEDAEIDEVATDNDMDVELDPANYVPPKPRDAAVRKVDLPPLAEGLSDEPFESPATNGTIGIGGGSSGAFKGRTRRTRAGLEGKKRPATGAIAPSGPVSKTPGLASGRQPPVGARGFGAGGTSLGVVLAENKRVLSAALQEVDALKLQTVSGVVPTPRVRLYGYTVEAKPEVVAGFRLYVDALNAGSMVKQQHALARLQAAKLPQPVFARLRVTAPRPTGGETYQPLVDNPFQTTKTDHTSTFSIDVDTASYANVRRMVFQQNRLPAADAVRIEEFINAFDYGYARPTDDRPIAMRGDIAGCPWNPNHRLARIALQAKDVGEDRPVLNLVFLIDVSGSMKDSNKLPLVKRGLSMLLENLKDTDRVGIVTYSNTAQVALQSTVANEYSAIQNVINSLVANGSTNGAGGIQMAYAMARQHFVKGASNRVILLTDGDFNVGISDDAQLEGLIAKEAKGGIDLSVLGFGMGNYKDGKLERLSNRGNGNYAYIDTADEARRALVDDMLGTLVTVARDVKIQLFFNPKTVRQWRLIGYANRRLQARDFNDDTKDAGEVGSGHAVTAFYEIVPVGAPAARNEVDPNPFMAPKKEEKQDGEAIKADSNALFQLRLRYKRPDQDASELVEMDIEDAGTAFDKADDDFQFATAAAGFGLVLRSSRYAPGLSLAAVEEIATAVAGDDAQRKEFLALVAKAKALGAK